MLRDFIRITTDFFGIIWRVRTIVLFMSLWLVIGAAGITYVEKVPFGDALYFTFITGLTIGYGDIVMKTPAGRVISILIGFIGIVFTGLIVAAVVETVRKMLHQSHQQK